MFGSGIFDFLQQVESTLVELPNEPKPSTAKSGKSRKQQKARKQPKTKNDPKPVGLCEYFSTYYLDEFKYVFFIV